jgi:hypothetical protein
MSGEHPNGRTAMDGIVKRIVENGGTADQAKKIARDAALREDRRRNK